MFSLRLPYKASKILNLIQCYWHYFKKYKKSSVKNPTNTLRICFACSFHGKSGGVQAIASIANILSKEFLITFISKPDSAYNPLLDSKIKIVNTVDEEADLFIIDLSCRRELLDQIEKMNKAIVLTCHGLKNALHGLSQETVEKNIQAATKVHFVSPVQQESYKLDTSKYFIIANTAQPVRKTVTTNNTGCVGNLDEPRKKAEKSVAITNRSNAKHIHLWGTSRGDWVGDKAIAHGWEKNKSFIYNSFDILVFMSELETFGLVVIEAMSCGVPCVLSDIPAFQEFKTCPGVYNVSDESEAVELVNKLLTEREEFKDKMIKHFQVHYSEDAVFEKWKHQLLEITKC